MSVPPNLMQQMLKQQGGQQVAGAPAQGPQSDMARTMPPAAAPFATPQEKRGLKATALAHVHIATTLLEQALPDLGHDTPEGQAVYKVIESLTKLTGTHGRDNSDLVPAEIMQLVKQLPQMGGGTPVQQELARQQSEQAMQQKLKMQQAAQGAGGGGAPPGVQ